MRAFLKLSIFILDIQGIFVLGYMPQTPGGTQMPSWEVQLKLNKKQGSPNISPDGNRTQKPKTD